MADFVEAVFENEASFINVYFINEAYFGHCKFKKANFLLFVFNDKVYFYLAEFPVCAIFQEFTDALKNKIRNWENLPPPKRKEVEKKLEEIFSKIEHDSTIQAMISAESKNTKGRTMIKNIQSTFLADSMVFLSISIAFFKSPDKTKGFC